MGKETVGDLMSKQVVAVLPGDTVQEAARRMEENNLGSLPVVSAGQLRGIVTDRDIALRCVAGGRNAERVKVEEIMTRQVVFLTSGQPVNDAVGMMEIEQVRRLPVVDNGVIAGVISVADVARSRDDRTVADLVEKICEPGR